MPRCPFLLLPVVATASFSTVTAANPWKGAELQSKETWIYGAFEARIRAADGGGMITPFFLLKDGTQYPGVSWQEMDFEVFGKDGGRSYQTQLMTPGNPRTEHRVELDSGMPLTSYYHTYRMEWTPKRLAFYLDGKLVREDTDYQTYQKLLDKNQAEPMRLRVSLWAQNDSWSGYIDPSKTPAYTYVSYVSAERYTPGRGTGGSDFTPEWRDDFYSYDYGRWSQTVSPASTTGVTDFILDNAQMRDGYLVLQLTDYKQTGKAVTAPRDPYKPR